MPITLAVLGYIFVFVAAYSCRSFAVNFKYPNGSKETFGWFSYTKVQLEGGGICRDYDTSFTGLGADGAIYAGKSLAIVHGIFGMLAILFLITLTFISYPKVVLRSVSGGIIFVALCSIIVATIGLASYLCKPESWRSPSLETATCVPAAGSILGMIGFLFWVGAVVSVFCMKEPHQRPNSRPPEAAIAVPSGSAVANSSTAKPSTTIETMKSGWSKVKEHCQS